MGQMPQQFRLQHELDLCAGIGDAGFEFADATVMPASLVDELQQHCTTLLGLRPKLPIRMASIPMLQGAAGGVDIGAYVGQLVGGGVSGAIVSAIVGLILNRMKSG